MAVISLQTDRLLLRNFRPDDWRDLQEIAVQSVASEYARYDHAWPTSDDEVRGVAEWFASRDGYIAVTLRTDGKMIGFVSLNGDSDLAPVHYDLGYRFNEEFHGQGYATEACEAVIAYAFKTLGADAMVAGTAEANGPSRALLARLGLRETGRSVASFRNLPDGQPDEFVGLSYCLTREEWEAGRADRTPPEA